MKRSQVVIGYGGEINTSKEKTSKPRNIKNHPQESNSNIESEPSFHKKSCITKKCIIISSIISGVVIIGIILLAVLLTRGIKGKNIQENKNTNPESPESPGNPNNPDNPENPETPENPEDNDNILKEAEAKKMIETEFEFSTKVGDLNRINVEQNYVEEITSFGLKYDQFVGRKTNYDIYILSETNSTEETKYFYNTTYTAAILISSQCIDTESADCEPEQMIGLADMEKSNLRFLDEIPDLKDIPLPLCIFNITNNDVITSIACPESLHTSTRRNMILDLYFFRPPAIKRPDKERNNVTITKTKKDGKELIIENNGGICDVPDSFESFCTTAMNTTVDSEGHVVTYDEEAFTNITHDSNTSYIKNKITHLKDESEKIAHVDKATYRAGLNSLIEKLKPYLKYYEQFTTEQFKELYAVSKNISLDNSKRNLKEENGEALAVEENLFNYSHYSKMKLNINLKNEPAYNSNWMKAKLNLLVNEKEEEMTSLTESINFDYIKKLFKILSKAGNEEASEFYNKIKLHFDNINDAVFDNITNLINLIISEETKSLANIFDPAYNMDTLKIIPMNLLQESSNLKQKLEGVLNMITNGGIKSKTGPLNEDIYNFILKSHKLVDNVFQNVRTLSKLLKSSKSKLTELSTYYLNNTPNSFHDIIDESKYLLYNYYIDEENLIFDHINSLMKNFTEEINSSIKSEQKAIDNLLEKLEDENMNITIENKSEEDKNLLISNLKDSKDIINSIISKVEELIKKEMDLKTNGHLISDSDITSTMNSYSPDINEASETAAILDNDESIDKIYDKTYEDLRENYTKLMKEDRKKIEEQMVFLDDALNTTLFSNKGILKKKINNIGLKIGSNIKNEAEDYLDKANKLIKDYLVKNNETLRELILNLTTIFSEDVLKELKDLYDIAIDSTLNNLDNIIENNSALARDYFPKLADLFSDTDKIIELLKYFETSRDYIPYYYKYWSRTHYYYLTGVKDFINKKLKTQMYVSKYNKFKNEIESSKEYIKDQLTAELKYEYKNVITKLKDLLQIVKNTRLNEKFRNFEDLKFLEENINHIDDLYLTINSHFSDKFFNEKYVNKLNEYKEKSTKKIIEIDEKIIEPNHLIINQFETTNEYSNDFCFAFKRKITYTCTNGAIYNQESSKMYCEIIGDESDNYKLLKSLSIYSDTNFQKFLTTFNRFHTKLNTIVVKYTDLVNELSTKLFTFEKEAITNSSTSENYKEFKSIINEILSTYYGDTIILSTYNYFQKDIELRTNKIFDGLVIRWKDLFTNLYLEIKKNMDQYKNSIDEFGLISTIYYTYLSTNISETYYDLVMAHERKEFNYTLIYYYNDLLTLVKSEIQSIKNEIPSDNIGFERVLDQRKNEVEQLHKDVIEMITNSQNRDINLYNQLYLLQVPYSNFFNVSYVLANLRKKIMDNCESAYDKIYNMESKKSNDMYSYIARYYLENSANGKQINEFFGEIENANFVDLEINLFKDTLSKNWKFDTKNFIKLLEDTLAKNNIEISNELSTEKEIYKKNLEKEITKEELFIKDNMREKINSLYKEGIKELKEKDIKTIINDLKEILKQIVFYLSKEKERLSASTTLYYKDYTSINKTIKEYKENIIGNLNEKIFSFVNEFREYLKNGVYSYYYERNLNLFITEVERATESYKDFKLLNSSYNIGKILNQIAQSLAQEYRDRAKAQIIHKGDEYIENLQILLNLAEIQKLFETELDKAFLNLNETLVKRLTIEDLNLNGYNKYDISGETKEELKNLIKEKYDNFCSIIELLKGERYNNVDAKDINEWKSPNFAPVSETIINIKTLFDDFIYLQESDEKDKVNELVQQVIQTSFNDFLDNLLPTFGTQFFERVIAYNENFKLNNLFDNLRWTFAESISFIEVLDFFNNINKITKDLKIKIYRMNDFDSKILLNNKEILKILNQKADKFIEDSGKFITEQYSSFLINDANILLAFDDNIKSLINFTFNICMEKVGEEYERRIRKDLKEKLIDTYTQVLEKRSSVLIREINKQKEYLKIILDNIPALDSDSVLNEINLQINITSDSIEEYKSHLKTFKIYQELITYLNNFGTREISPLYQNFQNIIINLNKNSVLLNLEAKSNEYKNAYNPQEFTKLSNKTYEEIKLNYIDSINNSSQLYYENYTENLDNRIKDLNLRRLEDNDEDIFNRKVADKSLDEIFHKLLNNSLQIKKLIISSELFDDFDKKISSSKNNFSIAYKKAKTMLTNDSYEEEMLTTFKQRLEELKNHSTEYYSLINESFYELKNSLKSSISDLNDLLKGCANITYETFAKKYGEYLSKVEPVNIEKKDEESFEEEEEVSIQNYQLKVKATSDSIQKEAVFQYDYEYYLDETGEINIPHLTTNLINLNNPRKISFKIEKVLTECAKEIEEIEVVFNNANYSISLDFSPNSENILSTISTLFDDYKYSVERYNTSNIKNITCFVNEATHRTICYKPKCIFLRDQTIFPKTDFIVDRKQFKKPFNISL